MMRKMPAFLRYLTLAAASLILTGGDGGTRPAEWPVYQKGRKFSVPEITVARGEAVLFVNDDTVPHNIMSVATNAPFVTSGKTNNPFDLGSQMPGQATPVSFSVAGTVVIICAIHPRMQMTIRVTE
jgi:plastocyanin